MSDVIATRITIDMDLSETAISAAVASAPRDILIVGPDDAVVAGRLAHKYGIKKVIVLPGIPLDYWCICGDYSAIYSEGA